MAEKVIIFGTGQIAEIAYYYLSMSDAYDVCGFTVDRDYVKATHFKDLPIVPFEEIEDHFPPSEFKLFAPMSYKGVNEVRKSRFLEGKRKGYTFTSYVSDKATIYNTDVGENCFIFEDNTIQPYAKIGDNVIIWSGNHIGHHSVIKDHCFITSHAVISGAVTIGEKTFIGVNATIRDNVSVGQECVIGAGSLVLKDLPDYSVLSPHQTEISRVPSHRLRSI